MTEIKRVFKPWFAWNTGKIERYLEEMALKGWRVDRVSFSQMIFRFVQDEPRKVRYCTDYQYNPPLEYFNLIQDDGWELMDKFAGWYIWRKPFSDEIPHLYTDTQSMIDRNRRLIAVVIFGLAAQIPMLSTNAISRISTHYLGGSTVGKVIFFGLYGLMISFLIYGLVRLWIATRKMQKRSM